jgi:hypothetical protein
MRSEVAEAPELTDEETDNVDMMITFSKDESNKDKLDFDYLVTNENMRNILGYNIPISDLPYLKVRKSMPQKPKENSEAVSRKGKEKVLEGPKKHKEPKEAPNTVKKLLADAQRIGAEQEKKAREVAEKKAAKLKAIEREAARLKAAEEDAAQAKSAQKRP